MKRKWKKARDYAGISAMVLLVIALFGLTVSGTLTGFRDGSGKGAGQQEQITDEASGQQEQVAEEECLEVMQKVKGVTDIREAAERISENGSPVTAGENGTMNMLNYEEMEAFLNQVQKELKVSSENGYPDAEECSVVLYRVYSGGKIHREEYTFDGKDMYVLTCIGSCEEAGNPVVLNISYTRIQEWGYTEKGWFLYRLCVPQPPEVSEIVDGNVLIRVRPLPQEYLEIAEQYIRPLGYMSNNLLRCDWGEGHMEQVDFTGSFESFYQIEYGKKIDSSECAQGIRAEEFETLMTRYLPVTVEELRKYAQYDEKTQSYPWTALSCGNYSVNAFSTSFPEITDMEQNEDGTVTFTIDAVCEMAGTDRALSHKLTVEFAEGGKVRYLKNEVLENGTEEVPEYEYRMQVRVLTKIFEGRSSYDPDDVKLMKELMFSGNSGEQKIYGKTGSGPDEKAWFVGFAEEKEERIYFVVYLNDPGHQEAISGSLARQIAENIVKTLL